MTAALLAWSDGVLAPGVTHSRRRLRALTRQIEAYCAPFEEAVVLLDTMPGVAHHTAEIMVAEMGTDMLLFRGRHP